MKAPLCPPLTKLSIHTSVLQDLLKPDLFFSIYESPRFLLSENPMEFSGSKKLKSSQEHTNGDRISNLPDSILHHILSFLDIHYSVQTSVLSRRWRYIWASLPTLTFNYNLSLFPPVAMCTDGLKDFVDQALFQRDNTNVQRFQLYYDRETGITRPNSWILYALRRNVQELCLNLCFDRLFRLPHCLFTSSSLTLLSLNHWGAGQHKLNLPDSIRLPALKTLFLAGIDFEDYDVTNNFFSSCPLLELLRITNCKMHHTHTIISLLKLKHLVIDNNNDAFYDLSPADGSLKLYAPNLITFLCHDFFNINYLLENLSSLVKAEIHIEDIEGEYSRVGESKDSKETFDQNIMKFLGDVQHVKALTLSAYVIQAVSRTYALLESSHTQFCNLRSLKIEYTLISSDCIHAIAYLLKISPNLETLSLSIHEDEDEDDDEDRDQELYDELLEYACRDEINFTSTSTEDYLESGLSSLQCTLHHLKYVEIQGISGCVNELKFLEILLKNAMVLRKVVLFCSKESPGNEPSRKRRMMKFSERLLTFPTSAPRIAFLFF